MRILFLITVLALPTMGIANLLYSLEMDLTGDGVLDEVGLIRWADKNRADLQITTETDSYLFRELVYFGGLDGQEASLVETAPGRLDVVSGNRTKGRKLWDQTLTIIWQDEAFRLAAFSHSWWNPLTPDDDGTCEIDFVSGIGVSEGPDGAMEIRVETLTPELEVWDQELPESCLNY